MSTTAEPVHADLEQADGDEDHSLKIPPPDPDGQTKAFDDTDYEREDLQIPKVDGQSIDKIRVKFSGDVMLDRSEVADVALYNKLVMGKECELRVAGKVSGAGAAFTTNREGDLDAVVGQKTVKVDTVWILDPEQLRA